MPLACLASDARRDPLAHLQAGARRCLRVCWDSPPPRCAIEAERTAGSKGDGGMSGTEDWPVSSASRAVTPCTSCAAVVALEAMYSASRPLLPLMQHQCNPAQPPTPPHRRRALFRFAALLRSTAGGSTPAGDGPPRSLLLARVRRPLRAPLGPVVEAAAALPGIWCRDFGRRYGRRRVETQRLDIVEADELLACIARARVLAGAWPSSSRLSRRGGQGIGGAGRYCKGRWGQEGFRKLSEARSSGV